jgi:predicted DsbA family dithiol-disulfide isomerase
MRIEIWSDVVCPWCYVGKRRFEAALSRFAHRDEVEVVWRAFELDPAAPAVREGSYVERLAGKYDRSVPEAQAMIDRMVEAGAGEGLDLRFDLARPGNTLAAHRLLHLARLRGVQQPMKERLLAATFTEGAAIGDIGVLVALAAEVGLDPDEVKATLEGDAFTDEVRADEARAAALGITGVPFFVIDGAYGVSGAQRPDLLVGVLEEAWAASPAAVSP